MQLLDDSVHLSKMWLALFTGDGLWLGGFQRNNRFLTYEYPRGSFPYRWSHRIEKDSIRFVSDFSWRVIDGMSLIMESTQIRFNPQVRVVTDDRIFPVFLLSGQGKVCAIANMSCYAWVNALSQIERSIKNLSRKPSAFLKQTLKFYGTWVGFRTLGVMIVLSYTRLASSCCL